MDKFLEKYNLPRLNEEEVRKLGKTNNKDIEEVIKNFQPRSGWLHS